MWTRNHKGNVFVGNLPRDFADERLAEAFDPYGIVLSAMVARDPSSGERLRYGFVDIATERAANAAISALHGTEVDGCKLNVKMSEKPAKKPGTGAPRRRDPVRRPAPQRRPAFDSGEMVGTSAPTGIGDAEGGTPAERPFQVQVIRRRTPAFQVERRPLPRRDV
jgi:RNA recognition motif-containing protein